MANLIDIKEPPHKDRYIDGFSCYRFYVAMKAHFNGVYDIVQYNWKLRRISESIYNRRKDKAFFENLAKRFTLGEIYKILFINFLENPNAWVGELSAADSIIFYHENYGKIERATYLFTEEIENLLFYCDEKSIKLKELLDVKNGQSIIFKMIQQKVISYETFILLNRVYPFVDALNASKDIIWAGYSKRINGYTKLLDINENKIKEILIKTNKEYKERK